MASKKYQMEWDHAAYYRKFHQTLSFVQIGDEAPAWKWIGAVSDNGLVYGDARRSPIGQYLRQCTGGEPDHFPGDYPIVQFLYQTIMPGAYQHRQDPDGVFYLMKRHVKSYKIGLSDETHNVILCRKSMCGFDRISHWIDMDRPIESYVNCGKYEVFSRKLVRVNTTLFADGDSIGFMESGMCMLRHPNFVPLVQPWLEDKWQIVS